MTTKEKTVCGFCGLECLPEEDVGWMTFPDGTKKPAHLAHPGAKEEHRKQTESGVFSTSVARHVAILAEESGKGNE